MVKLLVILGVIAYVIFPLDLLPDFIPVLGQADDLGAIVLGIKTLMKK